MQSNRQLLITFTIIGLISLAQFGCDSQSIQSSKAKVKDATAIESTTIATTAEAGESKLSNISPEDLIRQSNTALTAGNITSVVELLHEFRNRKNVQLMLKMDAARILFGAGQMKDSAKLYDEVLESRPEIKARLWQRGLALYYAGEFEKGVDQFDTHQTFNSQDVENSVWQLLCQSQLTSVEDARKGMIQIEHDSRIPMKQVFDMFAGTGSPEKVLEACGYEKGKPRKDNSTYHGLLYVGLFHEMMGDQEASNESMKEALKFKPTIPGLMGFVAAGHLRARKAYPIDSE
jgi:lipoprotein NlpI